MKHSNSQNSGPDKTSENVSFAEDSGYILGSVIMFFLSIMPARTWALLIASIFAAINVLKAQTTIELLRPVVAYIIVVSFLVFSHLFRQK